MARIAPIHMDEVTSALTLKVEVRGWRWFKVRTWLAGLILRLAAWILHCRFEVEG